MKNIAISENHLFKKVYDKGQKYYCHHIVVYVLKDYHASRLARENPLKTRVNRLGLTVSKKIGKAVVRSRIRRILRSAYAELDKNFKLKKGFLFVIVARESAINAKSTDIYVDLINAAKKLDMLETEETKGENK